MSKRFGRNQKRKLKAELEFLQCVNDSKSELINSQHQTIEQIQNQRDNLYEEMRRARNIAGNMCVLFAPEKFEGVVDEISNMVRIPIKKPLRWSPELEFLLATPSALHILSLEVMIAMVEERPWDNMKHILVKYGKDKRWGYAFTPECLRNIPKNEVVTMITEQLAHLIMQEL